MKSKCIAISTDQSQPLIGGDSGEGATFLRMENDAGMDRQAVGALMICPIAGIKLIDHAMGNIHLFDSSPSAIGDQLCQILFGAYTDR